MCPPPYCEKMNEVMPFVQHLVEPLCEAACCDLLDGFAKIGDRFLGVEVCDKQSVGCVLLPVAVGKVVKPNTSARRRRQHVRAAEEQEHEQQHVLMLVELFSAARVMLVAMVEHGSTCADKVKTGTRHVRYPSHDDATAIAVVVVSEAVVQFRARAVFSPDELDAVTAHLIEIAMTA